MHARRIDAESFSLMAEHERDQQPVVIVKIGLLDHLELRIEAKERSAAPGVDLVLSVRPPSLAKSEPNRLAILGARSPQT
ncbi:hypothetical protein [Bradyrhizobium jicamae]|uniref:hypothetical protein n=1 Tax=Bradyrhizobium jicamae TaxID=280332 RepID=UPI001BA8CA62|nr:hypothetical protein [Bradyrhizobium jicamae]MBR0936992.1 hypothetical protein [Bradyrhizobium jicamae]